MEVFKGQGNDTDTSEEFEKYLQDQGMLHSFSRKGNPYDNACIESFHSVLKKEEVYTTTYYTFEEAKSALFEYIESFYNRKRRHSALDYKTPQQVEDEALAAYATSWAQTGRSIPCYGTTHADYFYGEIPCVRCLTKEEINSAYEENTGHLIVSEFKRMKKDVMAVPAVLCKNHGPFSWGKDAKEAIHNAVVLEEVAKMAYRTELIHPQELQDKHYFRKHGANAYYGQN